MKNALTITLAITFTLTGCGASPGNLGSPAGRVDEPSAPASTPPAATTAAPDVAGTWATTGTWDLGGPFAGGATAGDLAATIVVDEIMGLAGVPSAMEEAVREVVEEKIGEAVREHVDENAPESLQPGGATYEALAQVFATAEVDTTIELDEDLEGTETIRAMRLPIAGQLLDVPLDDLGVDGAVGLVLDAPIAATRHAGDRLTIDEHAFDLRIDELAGWALAALFEANGGASQADAEELLICSALMEEIGDGEPVVVDMGLLGSIELSADLLSKGCDKAASKFGEKFLGLVSEDTGVIVGGDVSATDTDGDGEADRLDSLDGYGGVFTRLPTPIDPVILATFTGQRQ